MGGITPQAISQLFLPQLFPSAWSHDTQLGFHRAVLSMGSQAPEVMGKQNLLVYLGFSCAGLQVSWASWGLLKVEVFGLLDAFLTFHRILISSALDPAAIDYDILNWFSVFFFLCTWSGKARYLTCSCNNCIKTEHFRNIQDYLCHAILPILADVMVAVLLWQPRTVTVRALLSCFKRVCLLPLLYWAVCSRCLLCMVTSPCFVGFLADPGI